MPYLCHYCTNTIASMKRLAQSIYRHPSMLILRLKWERINCSCSKTDQPLEANFPFYFTRNKEATMLNTDIKRQDESSLSGCL
jgi:hypothetical protein